MITHVPRTVLRKAFQEAGLWGKIRSGQLREWVAPPSRIRPDGSVSQIVLHFDPVLGHVATTHRVIDARGRVVHWDEKDMTLPNGDKLCRSVR